MKTLQHFPVPAGWYAHKNDNNYNLLGMQPKQITFEKPQGPVCVLQFCDDENEAGIQIVMSAPQLQDFLVLAAKIREQMELKMEDDPEEDDPEL